MAWERGPAKCKFCKTRSREARIAAGAAATAGSGAADAAGGAEGVQAAAVEAGAGKQPAAGDYKNVRALQRLSTPQGKIFSRKRSGTCASHQRQVRRAIKRARFMALLPYVGR